jgi:hypothetical protein
MNRVETASGSFHPSSAWRIDELAAKVRKSSGFLARSALAQAEDLVIFQVFGRRRRFESSIKEAKGKPRPNRYLGNDRVRFESTPKQNDSEAVNPQ